MQQQIIIWNDITRWFRSNKQTDRWEIVLARQDVDLVACIEPGCNLNFPDAGILPWVLRTWRLMPRRFYTWRLAPLMCNSDITWRLTSHIGMRHYMQTFKLQSSSDFLRNFPTAILESIHSSVYTCVHWNYWNPRLLRLIKIQPKNVYDSNVLLIHVFRRFPNVSSRRNEWWLCSTVFTSHGQTLHDGR